MTPMQRATEAGARAAQPYAFNDAFWLAKGGPDRHQRHAQDNARRHALDAIRAALPILAEELATAVGDDPRYPLRALRARVQSMMEGR